MPLVREATAYERTLDIERLAVEHYGLVFRFCARRVGVERAADAAQETFITAWKVRGRFRGTSAVTTWLLGIAHNECRRILRKSRIESALEDWLPDSSPGEHQLVNREALRVALGQLSADHREVVLLHEVEGLTHDEAAEVLGIPVGTVKSRLHHALSNLRRALQPHPQEAK